MSERTCNNCLHEPKSFSQQPCKACVKKLHGIQWEHPKWKPVESRDAALLDVLAEMRRAQEKHGEHYMGNLPDLPIASDYYTLLLTMSNVGRAAKAICEDDSQPTPQAAVLMEEIGEVADALLVGEDPHDELVQCAAMALAWLGVEAVPAPTLGTDTPDIMDIINADDAPLLPLPTLDTDALVAQLPHDKHPECYSCTDRDKPVDPTNGMPCAHCIVAAGFGPSEYQQTKKCATWAFSPGTCPEYGGPRCPTVCVRWSTDA